MEFYQTDRSYSYIVLALVYCILNTAMQNGFLPYIKSKSQTPLRHTEFFIQLYRKARIKPRIILAY